jgi:hypothetical protein
MKPDTDRTRNITEWMRRPPARRANSDQASDFAYQVADRTDGSQRRYEVVMSQIRPLIGLG